MPEQISPQQENQWTGSGADVTVGKSPLDLKRFLLDPADPDFYTDIDQFQGNSADEIAARDSTLNQYNRVPSSPEGQTNSLSPRDKELMDFEGSRFQEIITELEKDKDLKFLDMVTVERPSGDVENDWYISSPTIDVYGKDETYVIVRKNDDSRLEKMVDIETLRGWQPKVESDSTIVDSDEKPYVGRHRAPETVVDTEEEHPMELLNRLSREYEEKVAALDADERQAAGIDDEVDLTTLYDEKYDAHSNRLRVLNIPVGKNLIKSAFDRAGRMYDRAMQSGGLSLTEAALNTVTTVSRKYHESRINRENSTERKGFFAKRKIGLAMGAVAVGVVAYMYQKNGLHFSGNSGSGLAALSDADPSQLPPIDSEPTPAVGSGVDHIVSAHSPLNETGAASPADVMPAGLEQSAPVEIIDYKQFTVSKGMGGESFAHQLGQDKDFWYANEKAFHKAFPDLTYKMSDGHIGFKKAGALSEKAAKWLTSRIN